MDVYLIIGDANTGKSSLIRCLTGCAQYNARKIALTNGGTLTVQVSISSLQESSISPSAFIQQITSLADCNAVLVPLWEHSGNGYPAASQYITAFQQAGWPIVKTALLNSQTPPTNYPQCKAFTGVTSKPINITSAAVRQHFEWI